MFRRSGTTWVEQTGFVHNGSAGDEFGTSVAIDGNHSIVGTPNKDVGSNVDEGKIYIFSRE
ncbi:MAG: FG-GAP repeat protein [Saprospiraceae bacterium]|nr:FG-GAP repeat protein [Saprospiraceae bacterium]